MNDFKIKVTYDDSCDESNSISDSFGVNDDNFDNNSPSSESDITDWPEVSNVIPQCLTNKTRIKNDDEMSSNDEYIIEDTEASSEGEWIKCLVNKLDKPKKLGNFCAEPLPRHLQVNYTSLETTHHLPTSSVQPIRPSDGVGSDIRTLEQNAARVKTPNRVCPKPVIVVVQINGGSGTLGSPKYKTCL